MSEIDTSSAEFKAAVAEAVAEATEGLKAKNQELLGKLNKAKQGQQIDPAEHAALEAELAETRQKLADAGKALTKATKDAEAAKAAAQAVEAREQRLLVDNGLNEALAKANVTQPALIKAAKAMLGAQAQVVADGDNRVVKIGDKGLGDFITEWAGTDEGKFFVTAPNNHGGGSQGGSGAPHKPAGNAAGTRDEAVARAAALRAQFSAEE